ncbi:MAG: hypothetical protein WBW04_10585 [Nitrolancea sp.]
MARQTATDATLIEQMFRTATTIRHFEEMVADLVNMRSMEGIAHLSIGQEAVASAVCTRRPARRALRSRPVRGYPGAPLPTEHGDDHRGGISVGKSVTRCRV